MTKSQTSLNRVLPCAVCMTVCLSVGPAPHIYRIFFILDTAIHPCCLFVRLSPSLPALPISLIAGSTARIICRILWCLFQLFSFIMMSLIKFNRVFCYIWILWIQTELVAIRYCTTAHMSSIMFIFSTACFQVNTHTGSMCWVLKPSVVAYTCGTCKWR